MDFQQGCQDLSTGKEECFQQMALGQLDSHMQSNDSEPPSFHHREKGTQNGSWTYRKELDLYNSWKEAQDYTPQPTRIYLWNAMLF